MDRCREVEFGLIQRYEQAVLDKTDLNRTQPKRRRGVLKVILVLERTNLMEEEEEEEKEEGPCSV